MILLPTAPPTSIILPASLSCSVAPTDVLSLAAEEGAVGTCGVDEGDDAMEEDDIVNEQTHLFKNMGTTRGVVFRAEGCAKNCGGASAYDDEWEHGLWVSTQKKSPHKNNI
jgi:hypothetical protein